MSEVKVFRQLIDNAEKEQELQSYLEKHPHLLIDMLISPNATVVSQFPLGSDFRADFAFVHSNSGGTYIELLELKYPKLKIFNDDSSFTQPFNHALQQIQDSVAWVRNNSDFVMRQIKSLVRYLKSDNLYVNGLLIIGRRHELTNKKRQDRFEARLHQLPRGLHYRTYDGFAEQLDNCENWLKEGYRSVRCLRYKEQDFIDI